MQNCQSWGFRRRLAEALMSAPRLLSCTGKALTRCDWQERQGRAWVVSPYHGFLRSGFFLSLVSDHIRVLPITGLQSALTRVIAEWQIGEKQASDQMIMPVISGRRLIAVTRRRVPRPRLSSASWASSPRPGQRASLPCSATPRVRCTSNSKVHHQSKVHPQE